MTEEASHSVTADAQFGLSRVLRPYDGFEAIYQGAPANAVPGVQIPVPVQFFEWQSGQPPNPRDDLAGDDGFDPNLLRYLDVPLGSDIQIWIPTVAQGLTPNFVFVPYRYIICWRLQSLAAQRRRGRVAGAGGGGQYHIPSDAPGVPTLVGAEERFILACSTQTILYNGPEPSGTDAANASLHRRYFVQAGGDTPGGGLLPGSVGGVHQQGVSNNPLISDRPAFEVHQVQALGDQMILLADRGVGESPEAWDFSSEVLGDGGFSNVYGSGGSPFLGIYVLSGTSP